MENTFFEFKKEIKIYRGDSLSIYSKWKSPIVIISDGPYGVSGFPGDLPTSKGLAEFYENHIKEWSKYSTLQTTLWFWNTELGWATVHPILVKYGWKFVNCHIWNKGIRHIAGNANTKSLRKLPVATEVCVQYTREPSLEISGEKIEIKEWLRREWSRTGLPFSKTNEAAGVKNAATRKYFTKDHLWYFPPPELFERIAQYANLHGKKEGRPFFSLNGVESVTKKQWKKMRSKFKCPFGVTNVWDHPPVNGEERLKVGMKALHLNQKPMKLMELIIQLSSEEGDLIWEPFGGLMTGSIAAIKNHRQAVAAEIDEKTFNHAKERIIKALNL